MRPKLVSPDLTRSDMTQPPTIATLDLIGAEAASVLGDGPLRLCDASEPADDGAPWSIRVGIDREGRLPDADPATFDALITTAVDAPAPWVTVAAPRLDGQLASVAETARRAPIACHIFARLLRLGETLAAEAALEMESLGYSTLLAGGEFARWRSGCAPGADHRTAPAPVRYARDGDAVCLTLASPENRNAMTAPMRDALFEALCSICDDPTGPAVTLDAEGPCFSTGGHLPEFGTAPDLALAHAIRTMRSAARLLIALGDRATVRVHGACIGSGIEIAAAAAHRVARRGSFVQLPELRMGLVPGAGGTVTLGRAIGRHRLMWLALGAFRLPATTAHAWGLFHRIEP